jgi:arsenite methyltransferase
MDEAQIKEMVRARYGTIATGAGTSEDSAPSGSSCCGPAAASCCGPAPVLQFEDKALRMGYSEAEVGAVPEGANLGLGCGNP